MTSSDARAIPMERGSTGCPATRPGGPATKGASPAGGGAVYGIGMIGALVYFIGAAESPSDYALALGKAVVWPALLVYRAFRALDG